MMAKKANPRHYVTGICGASIKATNFDRHMRKCSQCSGTVPLKTKLRLPFLNRKISKLQRDAQREEGLISKFKKREMI